MNVLFLQEQPCIRALKYAQGLRELSRKINLFFGYTGKTLTQFYGVGDELFQEWINLEKDSLMTSIQNAVKKLNIDLVHSHNAPDNLTVAALQGLKDKIPIVHDIHDLLSLRETMYDDGINRVWPEKEILIDQERTAVENSSAIITVSDEIISILRLNYNFDPRQYLVFPNYVNDNLIPTTLKPKLSSQTQGIHIVYEGHLYSNNSGHYDLRAIFEEIADQGINIHIYPSKENLDYKELAVVNHFIHYHGKLPPRTLLGEMTQYDFGWAGFNTLVNKGHTDTVLANKIFDYISAGLPVISFPHKAQKKFLQRNKLGIIVPILKNLAKQLKQPTTRIIERSVHEKRHDFAISKNIGKIHDLYRTLLS